MTDRVPNFAGPDGGTCTHFAKRPDLARTRLELGYLGAHGGARRPAGEPWTCAVGAEIEAREEGWPEPQRMRLDLPPAVALGFALDLLEGAAFCYFPEAPSSFEPEDGRKPAPLPAAEELRLLAVVARASANRSAEAARDLAWLAELCGRACEANPWPEAGRHESELDALRRAGLIGVSGYGTHARACPTALGRQLAAMLGGRP